jgi:membrane protease YdiL (CAAX protease family)
MLRQNVDRREMDREFSPPNRREQFIEVLVFLFLIIPSMLFSFFAIKQGTVSFTLSAFSTILRDLALLFLILFFLWRNRERFVSLGWTFKNGWKDILLGIVLFVPVFYGVDYLDQFLQSIGFSAPQPQQPSFISPRGSAGYFLAFIMVMVVAVTEETIFRGYLILRFKSIWASAGTAAVLSSLIFSLGHGYEGTSGVITIGTMGLVLAFIYIWRKSLVAPMVIHFLQDFLAIILLPLLAGQ